MGRLSGKLLNLCVLNVQPHGRTATFFHQNKWLKKTTVHAFLIDKPGIKAGARVAAPGIDDAAFVESLVGRTADHTIGKCRKGVAIGWQP